MIEKIKNELKLLLEKFYNEKYNESISIVVEEPKNSTMGEYKVTRKKIFNCYFELNKYFKQKKSLQIFGVI